MSHTNLTEREQGIYNRAFKKGAESERRDVNSIREEVSKEVYTEAYNKGAGDNRIMFVAAIEKSMAMADGYADPLKWREDFNSIPSWWIGCLMSLWETTHDMGKGKNTTEVEKVEVENGA